ncbi:hypothetical protein EMIT074MI3_12442 [Bacillus licheniformis]
MDRDARRTGRIRAAYICDFEALFQQQIEEKCQEIDESFSFSASMMKEEVSGA